MAILALAYTIDPICPWCYIGLKRLQRAIALYKKTYCSTDTFLLSFAPFQLDASLTTTPIPILERFRMRVGDARIEGMKTRLDRSARAEGIAMSWKGGFGNSRDALRLVIGAGKEGEDVQGRVVEGLFKGFFEEELNVTNMDELMSIGVQAGIDEGRLKEWMESGEDGEEVDRRCKGAMERGINGVPHLLVEVDGLKRNASGAQDVVELMEVFIGVKEGKEAVDDGTDPEKEKELFAMISTEA